MGKQTPVTATHIAFFRNLVICRVCTAHRLTFIPIRQDCKIHFNQILQQALRPVPQEKMFFVERAGEPVLVIFAILSIEVPTG